jgi:putative peptidoglycan lipid II flippase
LICLGANVVLNAIFIFFTPLKHAGLALATSLSSILNLILLCKKLDPKLGGMDVRKNGKSLFRVLLCSLPMGFIAYLICSLESWSTTGNVVPKIGLLGLGIVIGIGVYIGCSYWAKNEELIFLLKMLRKKRSI